MHSVRCKVCVENVDFVKNNILVAHHINKNRMHSVICKACIDNEDALKKKTSDTHQQRFRCCTSPSWMELELCKT